MKQFLSRPVRCGTATTLLLLLFLLPLPLAAQQSWTLRQCIDHALAHNIGIRQRENQQQQQELQLSTARWQRMPDLNASAGQNFSFGRGLTSDNTYTNTNTSSTSFSLGTSVPLFTGLRIPNTIALNRLNLEAATHDLEKARNDVSVQVAQDYVQVLYNMELLSVARRQTAIDSMQVARLQALLDNGKASRAELAQQEATLAQSRLTAIQAEGNLRLALLTLSQLLELPSPEGFSIAPIDTLTTVAAEGVMERQTPLPAPDLIFAEALGLRPEIQAEQLRLEAAGRSIAIARSGLYPQLSFSAGLGSNYYNTSRGQMDGFAKQMKNNFSQNLGFSLSIPIFNRFQTRNSIRSAKIDRINQQLALDNVKKQLYKEIQTAYYNTVTAQQKLQSSRQARESSDMAFRLTLAKYEQGKATITEFNEARNNLLRAESDLVQARYEHLYQTALIQFYRGQPLQL